MRVKLKHTLVVKPSIIDAGTCGTAMQPRLHVDEHYIAWDNGQSAVLSGEQLQALAVTL